METRWNRSKRMAVAGLGMLLGLGAMATGFLPAQALESPALPLDAGSTVTTVVDTVQQTAGPLPTVPTVPTVPTLPPVEIPDVDLPDVDLPDVDLPDVDLPDVDLPDVDLPDVDLPDLKLPTVGVPTLGGSASTPSDPEVRTADGRRTSARDRVVAHTSDQPTGRRGQGSDGRAVVPVRTTAEVMEILDAAQASDRVTERILAPFPVAEVAEFALTGGPVEVRAPAASPIVAPDDVTVLSADRDRGIGTWRVRLLGASGRSFELDGLIARDATGFVSGTAIAAGDVIGLLAGAPGTDASLGVTVESPDGTGTAAFLARAVDAAHAEAAAYRMTMIALRALGAGAEFDGAPIVSLRHPVPRPLALAAGSALMASALGVAWVAPGATTVAGAIGRRRLRFVPTK